MKVVPTSKGARLAGGKVAPSGAKAKPQMRILDRPLLSISDVQAVLRWGRDKVLARVESGEFQTVRDGCRIKIVRDSLLSWIEGQIQTYQTIRDDNQTKVRR